MDPESRMTGFPITPAFSASVFARTQNGVPVQHRCAQTIPAKSAWSTAKMTQATVSRSTFAIWRLSSYPTCRPGLCSTLKGLPRPPATPSRARTLSITSPMIYHRRSEHRESVALSVAASNGIAPSHMQPTTEESAKTTSVDRLLRTKLSRRLLPSPRGLVQVSPHTGRAASP